MMKFVSKAFKAVFPGKKKPKKAAAKNKDPETAAIEEAEAAIAEAIAAAKRLADAAGVEPKAKPQSKRKAPAMTEERARLIEEALAVQRSKAHVLDSLSKEAREKLTVMALKALAPNVLERMGGKGGDKRQAPAWPKDRKRG